MIKETIPKLEKARDDRYTYRYKGSDSCDGCAKQEDEGKGCAEDVHITEDEFGNVPFCVWRVSA